MILWRWIAGTNHALIYVWSGTVFLLVMFGILSGSIRWVRCLLSPLCRVSCHMSSLLSLLCRVYIFCTDSIYYCHLVGCLFSSFGRVSFYFPSLGGLPVCCPCLVVCPFYSCHFARYLLGYLSILTIVKAWGKFPNFCIYSMITPYQKTPYKDWTADT